MGEETARALEDRPGGGPIRQALARRRERRIMDAIGGRGLVDLLEVGCEAPARFLLPLCRTYTGCDLSSAALEAARARLAGIGTPVELVQGDTYDLGFDDHRFDAVFSAHLLYRIDDRACQAALLREMARVLAPGGVLVLVTANPRPRLFPVHALTRMVADSRLVHLTARLRPLPRHPYLPAPVGWITERLREAGLWTSVQVDAVPSEALERRLSERSALGRLLWGVIERLEAHPERAAMLGSFVTITALRPGAAPDASAVEESARAAQQPTLRPEGAPVPTPSPVIQAAPTSSETSS